MSNPKWEEQILVVPRSVLFDDEKDVFQGVVVKGGEKDEIGLRLSNRLGSFSIMRRGDKEDPTPKENNAEINFDFKQVITYAVIRKGDLIFLYERLKGGGESRLHNKLSIGVGGHMNDLDAEEKALIVDYDFYTLLTDNLERELSEELWIDSNERQAEVIGFVNDDSNEVGKVHLGILIVIDLDEDAEVAVNEPEQLDGNWTTLDSLLQEDVFNRLENWSQIAVKALAGE